MKKIKPILKEHVITNTAGKKMQLLGKVWKEALKEKFGVMDSVKTEFEYFEEEINQMLHDEAIVNNARADGRKMDEVRDLLLRLEDFQIVSRNRNLLSRRYNTFYSAYLGGPEDMQLVDGMEVEEDKRFMHYNFHRILWGRQAETGFVNRREVGHGALTCRKSS